MMLVVCVSLSDVLAVSKAFKTLENEEGFKRCQEIVDEAKSRVDEAVRMFILLLLTTHVSPNLEFGLNTV